MNIGILPMPQPFGGSSESLKQRWRALLGLLARQGGPEPADYRELSEAFAELAAAARSGAMAEAEIEELLDACGPAACSDLTLQGFVRKKPHGYPGDWEIIDRIYQHWISPDPAVAKWDEFFQAQAAPRAVRNRKDYFRSWLREAEAKRHVVLPYLCLLHLGGGSGREVKEYFQDTPESRILCTLVENDARAIAHAARLCAPFRDRINLFQVNPLGFIPAVAPHLVWISGLCDYLEDEAVAALIGRLWRALIPGGEIVAANFSPANPTRAYMELGGWNLQYRDAAHLASLARQAGVPDRSIRVASEPQDVILFLHLEKPPV